MGWAPLLPEAGRLDCDDARLGFDLFLPPFDAVPERIVDNPQCRHFCHNPALTRVLARYSASGLRILHVAQPVPNKATDVEFIVEQSGAAGAMSANGRIAPKQPAWPRNAIRVQPVGDGPGGAAVGKFAENAPDYIGFLLADRTLACYRFTVWI